jgi:hypothetical protein
MADLIGRRIVEVRAMTRAELDAQGWQVYPHHAEPVVLVLDDGTRLFPSQDEEGNGPGALFGQDSQGLFTLMAQEVPAPRVKTAMMPKKRTAP